MSERDEELAGTPEAAHRQQIEGRLKDLHTVLPGIIDSFDPATQTASVQPAIKRIFTERGPVALPVCVDVPVMFPGGGDFYLTFPVKQGDECTLHFSERCIDFWFANGGVQLPAEYRLHDLSDAFAFVGVNSQPRKIPSFNATAVELRDRARTTRITMKPDGTIEQHNAGGTVTQQPGGKLLIDMPQVEMTGTLKVAGLITGQGGVAFSGGSGTTMNISGNTSFTGQVSANGKRIDDTHTHPENNTPGGNTGTVN